ncbi:MAG: YajG family lipoprotein [Pseudomonadota bacterium]
MAGTAVMFVAACGTTSHDVVLDLQPVSVAPPGVGEGARVDFTLVDGRSTDVIGRRGTKGTGGAILAASILTELEETLELALADKGYRLNAPEASLDSRLKVTLVELSFAEKAAGLIRNEVVRVAISVDAKGRAGEYTNTYRRETEERQAAASTRDGIDKSVNTALNAVLERLLADEELDTYLSKRS